MRFRSRPSSVLAGALAGYLVLFLLVLPLSHDCDHRGGGAGPSDAAAHAARGPVGTVETSTSECLACLFTAQVRTGLTPAAPSLALSDLSPDRAWSSAATWPLVHVASPVLPRGPPAA